LFFKTINNIDKLAEKKEQKTQITKTRAENTDITTKFTEMNRVIREYYEHLHANKLDNPDEIGKFLERYKLPKTISRKSE
jgi:hypothetical protein